MLLNGHEYSELQKETASFKVFAGRVAVAEAVVLKYVVIKLITKCVCNCILYKSYLSSFPFRGNATFQMQCMLMIPFEFSFACRVSD